jgi:hypothetical protein
MINLLHRCCWLNASRFFKLFALQICPKMQIIKLEILLTDGIDQSKLQISDALEAYLRQSYHCIEQGYFEANINRKVKNYKIPYFKDWLYLASIQRFLRRTL